MVSIRLSLFIVAAFAVTQIAGHGMMLEPPNRSSLWRYNDSLPHNYEDNQNFCGGFDVQWTLNEGRCGVCGDPVTDPHPQANENTGTYGNGYVVRTYQAGSTIDVSILLTANHLGTFSYSLCVLNDPNASESGENCFQKLLLEDGSEKYTVLANDYDVRNRVVLPQNLTCERCVLRWHYNTGNSWGTCEDGTGAIGCGPQETFRSCADIAIV
ncbi:uncharacterized protein LOC109595143 [Aethina tumida]|uniref:uncharacterized protein LOC109595143 n=1 Tax=Aethina tumida TaxID=116153 RepID=UPI00096B668D|nr:uncharacterized protein LOC109595143 [Aethina tumida]